ncbi:RGS1-HXK1-interacting protein 1 [Lolium perenne]|uniref:RGS1-HXK1-interacting protein 1 n=1 Tax=Lolium perenne TaxID=4522 RepID=UPI0021EAD730|nr:RGS1-HXK1-interacting protein 1-like [Lolium perenne]
MTDATPAPAGGSPPPPQPENSGSISSMVASSASSAAAAAADFTRRGEAFGADMAAAARNAFDTGTAHAHSSAIAASDAANAAMAEALAAFPTLTHAAKQEFQWVKNEYLAREQMALGKIKEGVIMAIEHPGIAAGSTAVAGIVLLKRPRSYLIQRVRRIFVSKETLLSGIQAEVNHMRQTVNLVSNESQKLMDRAATAEKRFQKGWNTLREEGRAIQSELKQISDIENQAVGLKGVLDQLPRAHASEFRSEISGLASQVKKDKRVLNSALTKIVNYGVPI